MLHSASRRLSAWVALLAGLALLTAGCTTMRLEDTLPATAAASPPSAADLAATDAPSDEPLDPDEVASFAPLDEEAQPPPAGANATQPGGYPNLNIRPVPAAQQMTGAQRSRRTAELRAAQRRVQSATDANATTAPTAEQMRRLAREREEETLRRIEGR